MNKAKNLILAVATVIINNDGEILLVQEKRNKSYENSKGAWGLPAGKIGWKESIKKGLMREMDEELNIKIKPIGLIGVYQYCQNYSQCLGLAFAVRLIGNDRQINYNQAEIQAVQWLGFDQAFASDIKFRYGIKEVLEDYKDNIILPFRYVHFFDLRDNR